MGCFAYSSAIIDFANNRPLDPILASLFLTASSFILKETDNADEGLRLGRLLSKNSVRMLDRATNEDCLVIEHWGVAKVKEMNEQSSWDFRYLTEFTWAYLSAKHFLSICASSGLSIQFHYW